MIAAIFDLDGTLVDSRADLTCAVNLTRKHYNLPPLSLEEVCNFIGNGTRKLVERFLRGTQISIDEALAIQETFYSENLNKYTILYPGVPEGLDKLNSLGIKCAVVTNKPQDAAIKLLTSLKVIDKFQSVIGDDGNIKLKPDPAGILKFLSEIEAVPEKSWIVGDNYTDLEAGRRAKVQRCFAAYGFGQAKGEGWEYKATNFADSVNAIIAGI